MQREFKINMSNSVNSKIDVCCSGVYTGKGVDTFLASLSQHIVSCQYAEYFIYSNKDKINVKPAFQNNMIPNQHVI